MWFFLNWRATVRTRKIDLKCNVFIHVIWKRKLPCQSILLPSYRSTQRAEIHFFSRWVGFSYFLNINMQYDMDIFALTSFFSYLFPPYLIAFPICFIISTQMENLLMPSVWITSLFIWLIDCGTFPLCPCCSNDAGKRMHDSWCGEKLFPGRIPSLIGFSGVENFDVTHYGSVSFVHRVVIWCQRVI